MDFEELKAGGKLPSPTGVALSIFSLTQKPDVSLSEIGHAVQADPVLSGKLIKYANQLKAGSRVIASIPDALNLLGMSATRQITLGFSILNGNRKGECVNFDYSRYWSKCLAKAIVAQVLFARSRDARPEECFIGALLSDVGSLALATLYPEAYSGILGKVLIPGEKLEKERECFSTDHLELTAALLSDWMLPPLFCVVARHQENPETMPYPRDSREYRLCALWHFSGMLADAFVSGEKSMVGRMSQLISSARKIGLLPEEFASVCNQTISSWGDWSRILEVSGASLPSFEELMASLPGDGPSPMKIVVAGKGGSDLAGFLSSKGHAVLVGEEPEEALQLAERTGCHAVICLPELDFESFAASLRELPSGRFVHILALSREADEESVISAFEAGADAFVPWPASFEVIIAHLLPVQRARREE